MRTPQEPAGMQTGTVKRERALLLVEHVIRELDGSQREWPMSLIRELHVFGSFARGALDPHDVDLDVEFDTDWHWASHFATCLSYGRDPHAPFRRTLTGGKRGCQFQFNFRDQADFDMTLLWRRGDTLQAALDRLAAIRPDPAAGRAPREAMLPEFEGLDNWIPLAFREVLCGAISDGAINIERCVLTEGPVASEHAREHLDYRWRATSPLYRAARAVIADWEARGIDPGKGHLHGEDIRDRDTPHFAGFNLRYFRTIPACLTEYGGVEWLEVVHPTRTRPLDALRIWPGDRSRLEQLRWGQ
jgi:hypothetical protein